MWQSTTRSALGWASWTEMRRARRPVIARVPLGSFRTSVCEKYAQEKSARHVLPLSLFAGQVFATCFVHRDANSEVAADEIV